MRILKTILLVVSSALGGIVLFVVGVYSWFIYTVNTGGSLPSISWSSGPRSVSSGQVVSTPPEVQEPFLGTSATFSGDFSGDLASMRNKVLAGGPGTIAGSVTSGAKPVPGLRLRLALNGAVMSQWAETDPSGKYSVGVPYGKYRIDGYELHYDTTTAVLGGRNDSPANYRSHQGEPFTVAEGQPGAGLDLEYVVPVVKVAPKGSVSAAKPVVLQWQPYPQAAAYWVSLREQSDERDYSSQRNVFDCCEPPIVTGTSLDLSQRGAQLKKGYVYTVEITALDASRRPIANSSRTGERPDFKVSD